MGPATGGSQANCTVNGVFNVDRVIMKSGEVNGEYTGALILPTNSSLTASNVINQYGTLAMAGGTLASPLNVRIYGNVITTPLTTGSTLSAYDLLLQGPTTMDSLSGMTISAHTVNLTSSISVADRSTLTVAGSTFHMNAGSTLNLDQLSAFVHDGTTATSWHMGGTLNAFGATITTDQSLVVNVGTMNLLSTNTLAGNFSVVGAGVVNVGDATTFGSLTMNSGSLTVGAVDPSLPGGAGTINLHPTTLLTFNSAGTFTVKGGAINLPGITGMGPELASTSTINILSGSLNVPDGQPSSGNRVTGNVSNAGTISVGSSGLAISGNVTNSGTITVSGPLSMGGTSLDSSGTINFKPAAASPTTSPAPASSTSTARRRCRAR